MIDKYAPFTKDIWCQHQTLYPNQGITVYSGYDEVFPMAVGLSRLPLDERYASFKARISAKIANSPAKKNEVKK